jgi:hypothetical protein
LAKNATEINFTLCSAERRVAFCLVRGGIPTWQRARRKRRRPALLESFQEYFDYLTAFSRDINCIEHAISTVGNYQVICFSSKERVVL